MPDYVVKGTVVYIYVCVCVCIWRGCKLIFYYWSPFVSFLLYFSPCLYSFLLLFLSLCLFTLSFLSQIFSLSLLPIPVFIISCFFLFVYLLPAEYNGIFQTFIWHFPSIPIGLQAKARIYLLTGMSFKIPTYTPKSSEQQDTCSCIQRNGRSKVKRIPSTLARRGLAVSRTLNPPTFITTN
jgi:hypothetical protein